MIHGTLLHIDYPSGEMNIFIDKFFPATVERAKKVFQLVKEHEPYDALLLYYHLEKLALDYRSLMDQYSDKIDAAGSSEDYKAAHEQRRNCLRKYEQAKRNMRDLKRIAKLEV